MQWYSLLLLTLALVAKNAYALKFTRFGCSQLVIQREDPLLAPNVSPYGHTHQIIGGDGFNLTIGKDTGDTSTCTTCTFSEDFSNYWTPSLYYQKGGKFKRVPQIANQYLFGIEGGMTVYYMYPDDTSVNITAFAPGFRMLAGDKDARSQSMGAAFATYRCYTGKNFEPNPMGSSDNDTMEFPKQYCAGGIRVNLVYPNCWDGVNLDSDDHKSHVASGYNGCPSTHPVQTPQIMIEVVFDTGSFDEADWPTDGSQPLVWAQGDPTGYGMHADYIFAWHGDALQKSVDARCDVSSASDCPLKTQSTDVANACVEDQIFKEPLDDWLDELPGGWKVTTSVDKDPAS